MIGGGAGCRWALVEAFLFIVVPAAISYGAAASFVAHYWSVFSLDLWQPAAIGALSGAVLLIPIPAYESSSKA